MPNKSKQLTDKELAEVEVLAGLGMRFEDIALSKGMCLDTLKKYADEQLQRGKAKAKAQVMQSAFKMATNGKTPAMTMFWLKTQCGWREVQQTESLAKPIQMNKENTIQQVNIQLIQTLQCLTEGKLDPKLAGSIASLANTLLRGLQQGEIEDRLTSLEAGVSSNELYHTPITLDELS